MQLVAVILLDPKADTKRGVHLKVFIEHDENTGGGGSFGLRLAAPPVETHHDAGLGLVESRLVAEVLEPGL